MKQIKPCIGLSFALLILFSTILVRGGDVPGDRKSKLLPTERGEYELVGTVEVDDSQEFSPENLAILATSKSFEEFFRVLGGLMLRRSAANVVVTAKGASVTKKIVTDSQGEFKFTGLPDEQYEISAEMPSRFFGTGEKRMAIARIPFEFRHNHCVDLELRTDLVTVKGRITDSHGRPIAGAKIRGEPYADLNRERAMSYPTRYAISGADGSYELRDMVPLDILKIAGYLMGGDPTSFGQYPFYVIVSVEASGYVQDKKNKPQVPLVTEELLDPARRLVKIMNKLETLIKGSSDKLEKKDIHLPASHSNTITGIDIVLKKSGDAGQ